ncbi:hypothetical protein SAMN05421688_2107 [Poseidonocella pacifica]|uniref:Antifreeze protein n=1 Tax=Poseidonocella pacifica TaxID=871651 RepID=A0A1I0XBT7_9RHOB|nr:hypothetical protein [Poseidonocella pacifica]SFA98495.1 hypothetical protein SAMN05421688_2107 [Poseidonocella pacifica]
MPRFSHTAPIDPLAMWSAGLQVGFLLAESQAVIAMRLWGMAGLWSVSPGENNRMVDEKLRAAQNAGAATFKAIASGQSPDRIASAAIRPFRKATRANHRRLTKRGPKAW